MGELPWQDVETRKYLITKMRNNQKIRLQLQNLLLLCKNNFKYV